MIKWLMTNKVFILSFLGSSGITVGSIVDIITTSHTVDVLIVLVATLIIVGMFCVLLGGVTAYSQELELTKKINDLVDYYIIEAEKTGKTGTEKSQQVIEKVSAEISSFVSCEKIQRVIEQKINQINFFAKPKAK